MLKPKLILFDIDGTILQFKHSLAKDLFTEFLTELFEFEVPASVIPSFAGMTDLQILRIIAHNLNMPHEVMMEKLPHIWDHIRSKFEANSTTETIKIMPGIIELLELFENNKEIQLGLITGNFIENAYIKLKPYNLSHLFPFGAFGDDDENRNNLPPIAIRRANEFLNNSLFDSSNTIIIGDTDRDIECARTHGIKSVAVATGGCSAEMLNSHNPDLFFENFADYNNSYKMILNLFN